MKRQPAAPLSGEDLATRELWIDVSAHQGEINWPVVAQDEAVFHGNGPRRVGRVVGVIVRLGEGKDVDERAVRNLQGAHEAGLETAGYQYFRADRGGAAQAAQVLETIRVAGVPLRFVALDREAGEDDNLPGGLVDGPRSEDLDPALVTREALEFCATLEAAGYLVVVYGGQWLHWAFAQARPKLIEPFAQWPLWCPWYTTGDRPHLPADVSGALFPWKRWALWQFAGSAALPGRVEGIAGRVDLNWLLPGVLENARVPASAPTFHDEIIVELAELAIRAKLEGELVVQTALLRALEEIENLKP